MLDSIYGQVMRLRRRRVERHPQRQKRLARPVISVGNLSMGGTGKTPVVAAIAQFLIDAGERPSILSRGYGRAAQTDGVVVVCDGQSIVAPLEVSGDEPLMLARQVPRAVVCVCPDRHLAGTLAEKRLGCTTHILDDGFQHLDLARDLDVLVTTVGEIPNGRVLPMGKLREPMDAAARAHFLVVSDATAGAATAEAWTLGIQQSCAARRMLGQPISIRLKPETADAGARVLAVSGIAHPDRFVTMVKDAGWNIVASMAFPDHHRYTARDVAAIETRLKSSGADVVFTTDKDAVRLESIRADGVLPWYRVPLVVHFDPPDSLFASVMAAVRR